MRFQNVFLIAIVGVMIAGVCIYAMEPPPSTPKPQQMGHPLPREIPVSGDTKNGAETSFKISVIGDCTLGYDYRYSDYFGQTLAEQGGDYNYFFRQVEPYLGADDFTVANMEGTLTNSSEPGDKGDPAKCYYFKGPPEYVKVLEGGSIEAVNLANNHSLDYMESGHADTKAALDAKNITHFGYEEKPVVEVKGVRIGLLGYNLIGPVLGDGEVQDYKAALEQDIGRMKGDADLVLVGFHWGKEGSYTPESEQAELGRFAIDLGADLVMGDHPHVLQPIEEYKGKYIIHSLGNFCFGGNRYPADFDGMIFQQEYSVWKSDSQTTVTAERPEIIPISISSDSGFNDFQPSPLPQDSRARVFTKLNWQQ